MTRLYLHTCGPPLGAGPPGSANPPHWFYQSVCSSHRSDGGILEASSSAITKHDSDAPASSSSPASRLLPPHPPLQGRPALQVPTRPSALISWKRAFTRSTHSRLFPPALQNHPPAFLLFTRLPASVGCRRAEPNKGISQKRFSFNIFALFFISGWRQNQHTSGNHKVFLQISGTRLIFILLAFLSQTTPQ